MILAIDVDYKNQVAHIAGVAFEQWADTVETAVYQSTLATIRDYEPGRFYRRELPCILHLLEEHRLHPDIIVVDGFVYLDGTTQPGLGYHLYTALKQKVAVLGVAKNRFKEIPPECELYRGISKKPLYVTCVGMELAAAKRHVSAMDGKHRIPVLLKKADSACRQHGKAQDHNIPSSI